MIDWRSNFPDAVILAKEFWKLQTITRFPCDKRTRNVMHVGMVYAFVMCARSFEIPSIQPVYRFLSSINEALWRTWGECSQSNAFSFNEQTN